MEAPGKMDKIWYVVIDKKNYFKSNFFVKEALGTEQELKKLNIFVKTIKTFDELIDLLTAKPNYFNGASIRLLWHLTSSGLERKSLSDAILKIRDILPNADLKIAKSENVDSQNIARKSRWFHLVGNGSSLRRILRQYHWDAGKIVQAMPSYKNRTLLNEIATEMLAFLLPLLLDTQKLRQFLLENNVEKASERLKRMSKESLEYYNSAESKMNTFLGRVPKNGDELSDALADLRAIVSNLIKSLGLLGEPEKVTTDSIAKLSNFYDVYEKIRHKLRKAE